MTSNRAGALLLAAAVLLGCGHYGPPQRDADTADVAAPSVSADPAEECEDEEKQP